MPNAARIVVLWDATTAEHQLRALSTAAQTMSIELQVIEFGDYTTMLSTLDAGLKERSHALVQLSSPLVTAGGAAWPRSCVPTVFQPSHPSDASRIAAG